MPRKQLRELLESLSRKFHAKLTRTAEECKTDEATVLNQGIEYFRQIYKITHGPKGEILNESNLEKIYEYMAAQSAINRIAAKKIPADVRHERAKLGAAARIKSLKAKKKAADSTARRKVSQSSGDSRTRRT